MLANEPVFVRLRDVEVPCGFPHQVKILRIYLELVVRGVVEALHCRGVLVLTGLTCLFVVLSIGMC